MRRSVLALAMAASLGARADGAFPTGMSVLLPAAQPRRILVGATTSAPGRERVER